jgi:hypothetical protein
MLTAQIPQFYKVKRGQTIREIAAAFSLPECALIAYNRLQDEVAEGQILRVPRLCGNLYTVQAGDSVRLLFGDQTNFSRLNLVDFLYPGMTVLL